MHKPALVFLMAASSLLAQYKTEPAGSPPAELAPAVGQALQQQGTKVLSGTGALVCEIWFVAKMPSGGQPADQNVTLGTVPQGALLGAIRFSSPGSDRRGQPIKPGVYTLRYGLIPVNGDHQGASPQRDFAVLTPAGEDKDAGATPSFEALMGMSRKASGTPHPAVLSIWGAGASDPMGFTKQGDSNDWALTTKIGDTAISIILVGKYEG